MSRGTEQRKTNRRGAKSSGKDLSSIGTSSVIGASGKDLVKQAVKILRNKQLASISHNFSSHPLSRAARERRAMLGSLTEASPGGPEYSQQAQKLASSSSGIARVCGRQTDGWRSMPRMLYVPS